MRETEAADWRATKFGIFFSGISRRVALAVERRSVGSGIEAALRRNRAKFSAEIVEDLLHRVTGINDPELDNVSFSVVKVLKDSARDKRKTNVLSHPDIRCVG